MKQTFTKLLGGALLALLLVPSTASATITAKWDWKNNTPEGIRSIATIQTATGTVASNIDGVTMFVDATSGKLGPNGDNAQFNSGTILHIPVVSTSDVVTFTPHPSGYAGVTIGDDDYDDTSGTERTHTATVAEVKQGYVQITSKGGYLYTVQVELAYKPTAEVTVASWTFDTGYDVSSNTYTPNATVFSGTSQSQSKAGQIPQIIANDAYNNKSACIASIGPDDTTGKIYWKLYDNELSGNHYGTVLAMWPYNGIKNTSTDFTNKSNHIVYYEFKFPATGLKNVNISYSITYANNTVYPIYVAYSTDNGDTWSVGTIGSGGSHWSTYATNSSYLDVDNASSVIVHLLPYCAEGGDRWFYLDEVSVTGKPAATPITITSAQYATYYNSIPVKLPENLQAATIDGETSGTLTLNWRYAEGDVIPGGTPVLLKATTADTYNLIYAANNTESAPSGNLLYGSDIETTTTGGGTGAKYYALQNGANGLGFYYMAAEGAAFTSDAHKAWLALPAATPARFFSLDDSETTSINAVQGSQFMVNEYFDLQGRRVAQPTKGLYIVNGKKVIIK